MNIEQTFSDEALHRSSSQCQGSVFMEFLTNQKTCVSVAAACIWCRQSDRPSLANCWRTHWLLPSGKIDGILKQELLYNLFERRCIKKCSALLRLHVHTSCLIWQFDELFCCGHANKQILTSTNNTFYWSVLLDFLKERTRFEKKTNLTNALTLSERKK